MFAPGLNRCARCMRPLFSPASVTVTTKDGVRGIGPKCAKSMGLLEPAQPRRTVAEAQDQPDLFDEPSEQKCKVEF